MSRFDRISPTSSQPAEQPSVIVKPSAGEGEKSLKALQDRKLKLQERRIRREIDRDNANKEIQACQKAAAEFGISTLDELKKHVEELEKKDQEALAQFVKMLDEEEALLNQIDQALAQLDRNQ